RYKLVTGVQTCALPILQKGFSLPKLTVVMRSAGTPSDTRSCFTALARRSPRPKLYSVEPRSSQWPSMVTLTEGCALRKSAVLERDRKSVVGKEGSGRGA